MLVEDWLALGIQTCIVEADSRRVRPIPSKDAFQYVVCLVPRLLIEKRLLGLAVNQWPKDLEHVPHPPMEHAWWWHNALHTFAEEVKVVVHARLNVFIRGTGASQGLLELFQLRRLKNKEGITQPDEVCLLYKGKVKKIYIGCGGGG